MNDSRLVLVVDDDESIRELVDMALSMEGYHVVTASNGAAALKAIAQSPPDVILLESFLSFLGLGVQPPASSWGQLISFGVETMEEYPWQLIWPAVVLSVTLFALNFLGDGLRDALDPRSARD